MAEATNPITTASNPRVGPGMAAIPQAAREIIAEAADLFPPSDPDVGFTPFEDWRLRLWKALASAPTPPDRVGEEVGRADFPGDRFEGDLTLREAALEVVNWFDKDGAAGTLPDYIMDLRAALKAAPSPDPAGAGGHLDAEAKRIMDAAWPEYGGNNQSAEFWQAFDEAVGFTLKLTRSGKLVASTGSGKEETKGGWQPRLVGADSLARDRKGDVTINIPTALCWLQFRPDSFTGIEDQTRPGVGFSLVAYPGSAGEWPNGVIPRDEAFKLYQMLGRFFEKHPPSDAPSTTEADR